MKPCIIVLNMILLFYVKRWLDKLGIAALMNHSRVMRQSFVGVNYSLLDSGQRPLSVSTESELVNYDV